MPTLAYKVTNYAVIDPNGNKIILNEKICNAVELAVEKVKATGRTVM